MSIPVDSDVPVPEDITGFTKLLRELEVGESFIIPKKSRGTIQSYASNMKRFSGKVFTIRKIDDDTYRCWRKK